jgi:hypothetical protein
VEGLAADLRLSFRDILVMQTGTAIKDFIFFFFFKVKRDMTRVKFMIINNIIIILFFKKVMRLRQRRVGIITGNPGVFQGYPHPYPSKPTGAGFRGYGCWFLQNPRVLFIYLQVTVIIVLELGI